MLTTRLLIFLVLFLEASSQNFLNRGLEEIASFEDFEGKVQEVLENRNNTISQQCAAHLREYAGSLKAKKLWARKMFDAGGKIQSGILEGNLVELGSFDECLKVEESIAPSEKIIGKYCLAGIPAETILGNPPDQLEDAQNTWTEKLPADFKEFRVLLGTCLPDTCSANDLEKIFAEILEPGYFEFREESCQTEATMPKLDGGAIATLSLLSVILATVLLSTGYDVATHCLKTEPPHRLLIAFSVLANGKMLLSTKKESSQISCLHGIRVFSIMWIMLSHTYTNKILIPIQNLFYTFDQVNNRLLMPVRGATYAVDSFLLMSGLLIVYVYMREMQNGRNFNIFLFYFNRYLRITPVVAVVALIHVTLVRHLGSGPLWPQYVHELLIQPCEKHWWKALLYIQNYINNEVMCVSPTWYLSVDMQIYLVSPILLIPLKRWPKFTLSAASFLTACSMASSFISSWIVEFYIGTFEGIDENYWRYYYFPTWTRAAPWFIGFILGYLIFKIKQRKTKFYISKIAVLVLWAVSLAVLLICVFAPDNVYVGEYNKVETSFFVTFVRPSWSVALGWIIFACVAGYGGPVDWFLSTPLFQVVSRMSYSLFVLHLSILVMLCAQMRHISTFDHMDMILSFWGLFAFTFAFALILTLAFESPLITVQKILLRRGNEKKTQSSIEVVDHD